MVFVNLSLLLGTLLVGVPIVLHLAMRPKPRQLVFPALQFLRNHHQSNRRTLRLRHWLLLLLRTLLVALAALALARPSVSSHLWGNWLVVAALAVMLLLVVCLLLLGLATGRGARVAAILGALALATLAALVAMVAVTWRQSDVSLIGDREAPVAAVMVFDSSPRMQYQHENRSRLEQAQQMADWLVRQLPPDSQVAVLDSRGIAPVFSVDLAAARKTVERVKTTGAPRGLDQLLTTALSLVRQSVLRRREVYLFTDLAAAAWSFEPTRLQGPLRDASDTALYVIDVGVDAPRNIALSPPQLSAEITPEAGSVTIGTTISATGVEGRREVELWLEDLDPSLPVVRDENVVLPAARLRDRQEVDLRDGAAQTVEFSLSGLKLGTQHAQLRLVGPDALAADNVRHVTVVVRPPWLVLIAAPPTVDATGFVEAIAPYQHRVEQRAAYECLSVACDDIGNHRLEEMAAIVLLDPSPLSPPVWEQLGNYVRQGGALAMFLGHHAGDGKGFASGAAQELLPGRLARQYRVSGRDVYLAPHSFDHPVLRPFRPIASAVPWNQFPVFRHWSLQELAPDTTVVLRYGNGQPAILERPVGRGTVLTMTTPITELERPPGRQAWNELAGPDDWPRFILVNEIMRYLTQQDAGRFNIMTGQQIVLANRSDLAPARYLLFTPDGETQPIQARDEQLTITTTEMPGTYRLKGERDGPVTRGFSANLAADASRLERTSVQHLDTLLGEDRYQLAREREQIVRVQGTQRAGREFFPLLMVLLAVTLLLEQLLANRFYPDQDASTG